jgi:hypothetical protein
MAGQHNWARQASSDKKAVQFVGLRYRVARPRN